jgi:pimeloyl-ACP methyl ester carboxylesterase
MQTELITFKASDGFPLDGLVYTPDARSEDRAALLVHGKVMNFYTGPGRILPPHLAALGWNCLAMNRRGHDLGGIRNGRESYGGSWERFGDSQLDIAAGIAELKRRGFTKIVLIGHSFGGISSAAYAADHPDEVAALALCSAGSGGRAYLEQSSRRGMLAAEHHAEVDAEARRLVAAGQGDRIIALKGWWYAISAASWVDLSENVPGTVENARRYPGPVLALRGSKEAVELYPAEAVAEAAGARATLAVIPGGDHFYNGVEADFAQTVCAWFRKTGL